MPIHKTLKNNPNKGEEMIITLTFEGDFAPSFNNTTLRVQYIPERDIIEATDFENWLIHLQAKHWQSIEEIVGEICKAFYNAILPFYVHVECHKQQSSGLIQQIDTIKMQPQYKVPHHLERYL